MKWRRSQHIAQRIDSYDCPLPSAIWHTNANLRETGARRHVPDARGAIKGGGEHDGLAAQRADHGEGSVSESAMQRNQ